MDASKEIAANKRFTSTERFLGGEKEKVSICLFSLNSSVSCGFFQLTYLCVF